ncbi:MAG TPA: bacillithiol biosynthesis deacetylase BshB1, partial [Leptospiraceae bacterium]|nr:bacillithiol biosynthesis deacetylase BshB1 [Leptospiraceae bacterium]
ELHLETKKSAILCYQSQFVLSGKTHLIEHLMTENRYWGFQGGCDAAEPFFQKELPLIRWPEGIA